MFGSRAHVERYNVPLRDAPTRGVAQERIANDTAFDIVSHAYATKQYDVMKYLNFTAAGSGGRGSVVVRVLRAAAPGGRGDDVAVELSVWALVRGIGVK